MGATTQAKTKAANGSSDNGGAPTHASLAEALVAAQAEMPPVERDGTNPHFKSRFTTLGHLLAKARPVLNRHGLSVIQLPARGEDGAPTLRTTIIHTSGEKLEADAPLLPVKSDPQALGSAITYMRRYALASALGISDQDDDDGEAGSQSSGQTRPQAQAQAKPAQASERPITAKQKGKLNALFGAAELPQAQASAIRVWWTAKAGAQHFDRLPSKAGSDLIEALGEDGSGAREILAEIDKQAKDGNSVAATLVKRMEAPNA